MNMLGEQVGKWLKHKKDVFSPNWTFLNSSISHLPRLFTKALTLVLINHFSSMENSY
jgi:hypothetical protein